MSALISKCKLLSDFLISEISLWTNPFSGNEEEWEGEGSLIIEERGEFKNFYDPLTLVIFFYS